MPYSNYLDQKLNQLILGGTAYTIPTTVYFGLSTTTPNGDGTNVTEPSGNNYARVSVANDTLHFHAFSSQPANGQKQSNVLTITFNVPSGSWGTCTYLVVYDASSAGNLLMFGALTSSQTPANGDTVSVAADAFTCLLN